MNSHRDNVKDAIESTLINYGVPHEDFKQGDLKYSIADAVFDALGITEDEQDRCNGYYLLHASKNSDGVALPPPAVDKVIAALRELEKSVGVEYITPRKEELKKGAKYQPWEFKAFAESRQRFEDGKGVGWYITLQTPICRYGQSFDEQDLEICKTRFSNSYYPMYLTDYERSQEIAKVDK